VLTIYLVGLALAVWWLLFRLFGVWNEIHDWLDYAVCTVASLLLTALVFTTAVAIVTPFTYVAPPPDTAALACENRCMARHHDCGIVRGGRCFCTVDGLFRKARRWP